MKWYRADVSTTNIRPCAEADLPALFSIVNDAALPVELKMAALNRLNADAAKMAIEPVPSQPTRPETGSGLREHPRPSRTYQGR
jgi:hypothetical protein